MNKNSISEKFKVTLIFYSALMAGQLILFAVALIAVKNKIVEPDKALNEFLIYLMPIIGFVAMLFAHRIYLNNISKIEMNKEAVEKFLLYRKYKIIQWTIIEVLNLVVLMSFIITGNYLYSIIFLFLVGFFVLIRPTQEQFKIDFGISDE